MIVHNMAFTLVDIVLMAMVTTIFILGRREFFQNVIMNKWLESVINCVFWVIYLGFMFCFIALIPEIWK